ncbi:MAG: hypothetical protein ACK56I_04935, partial [bacterium]
RRRGAVVLELRGDVAAGTVEAGARGRHPRDARVGGGAQPHQPVGPLVVHDRVAGVRHGERVPHAVLLAPRGRGVGGLPAEAGGDRRRGRGGLRELPLVEEHARAPDTGDVLHPGVGARRGEPRIHAGQRPGIDRRGGLRRAELGAGVGVLGERHPRAVQLGEEVLRVAADGVQ